MSLLQRIIVTACVSLLLYQTVPVVPALAGANPEEIMKKYTLPPLTKKEEAILFQKHTEYPGTGEFLNNKRAGTYVCRNCGSPLYESSSKFDSSCGWPSFDEEIPGRVQRKPDADGSRTEILCANCGGHLGHVFFGEGFTQRNTRHCVNSLSMSFVPEGQPLPEVKPGKLTAIESATSSTVDGATLAPTMAGGTLDVKKQTAQAIFAGGCFWGVEHILGQAPGVLAAESGYSGGTKPNPTYEEVCTGKTGHAEAVRVTYDPSVTNYEALARLFFELHDPTQLDRQGPDIGSQYRSIIFYATPDEKSVAEKLSGLLKAKGYDVVTAVQPVQPFYPAEEYHQDFIVKHPNRPCHLPVKRFD